ncbi:hypothetical protein LTR70_004476 [Exophiala xenobiotica]|uniref:Uncharacterized protein n=1 Tax=Lithohypha guttulata TaxID=1690604 RepID=A0ABR0KDL1_9EURO|nr:hypothetical protein LTR24_003954 [Lithohypha guttulata]KAK5320898.1 hypothetical protein LTR70_004476 [Exophiala xenobiotica]
MVAMYTIAGRQVGSHVLAMATLGVLFGGSWAATRGGSKAPQSTPPINAGSKDEEKFIQEFLQSVEQEDKKAKIEGKQPH